MTERDRERRDEGVEVVAGVPTDRVRWGPVLAGTFAAFTAFAVLSTLGSAIGLSAYDAGDNARRFAIGAGIFGVLSMLLSFGFGGWIAGRSSAARGSANGLLNGFMVAAFGIPVLIFALSAASLIMSHAAIAHEQETQASTGSGQGDARTASAVMPGEESSGSVAGNIGGNQENQNNQENARRAASTTAWGTLISLLLAIGAASALGLAGARGDQYSERDRDRDRRRDTISGTQAY